MDYKETADKNVNHPSHYTTNCPEIHKQCSNCGELITTPIECIDVIRDMPIWKGCAIKYLWRAGLKKDAALTDIDKEIEDLRKAVWYIEDRIKKLILLKKDEKLGSS